MNAYTAWPSPRPVYNPSQEQIDVSTQADLIGYESEDERLGRRSRSKRGTPYSKVDIREQYCINNKEVQVLESGSSALFGCLSKHHDSSCRSRHSFLSVCVGRMPSDENLHDVRLQPLPRKPIDDLERVYLRRRPKSLCGGDSARYTGMSAAVVGHFDSDYEYGRMRRGHTLSFSSEDLAASCPAHCLPPPPPPPASVPRTKHVSFARSHTLTSFDDAIIELRKTPQLYKSQERLILSTQPQKRPLSAPYDQKVAKKTPMKTQATQTGFRGGSPPTYLSLSPRTIRRVKMVSQGAQTNGQPWTGRRLMKSYSEAGCHYGEGHPVERSKDHDALTRTQSEEPRSPYSGHGLSFWSGVDKENAGKDDRNSNSATGKLSKIYKEIFIDFEPVEMEKRPSRGFGNGDFLLEQSMPADADMDMDPDEPIVDRVDGVKVSLVSFSAIREDEAPGESVPGQPQLIPRNQDSVDEEFHENLVYGGIFNKFSSPEQSLKRLCHGSKENSERRSGASTPDEKDVPATAILNVSLRASPFASSDSLTNDQKDHSDGIWNESQSTVLLQADSENGEMGRTPSKKQLLLLQHQQRSSIDTEVLENDVVYIQEPAVPFAAVAATHQKEPKPLLSAPGHAQSDRKASPRILGAPAFFTPRENHRKSNRSPEKEDLRLDAGKVTDISETSTTEDYATAHDNSGTDTSSKRSARRQLPESKTGSKEGSSFESASSAPSFAKEDTAQVMPSSPPTIREENAEEIIDEFDDLKATVSPEIRASKTDGVPGEDREELSGDAESSSSGSYSLDSGQRDGKTEWSDQDKAKAKRQFKLELPNDCKRWRGKVKGDGERAELTEASKPDSTSIGGPGVQQCSSIKEEIKPKMVRSPAMSEGFLPEDRKKGVKPESLSPDEILVANPGNGVSSDESSYEYKGVTADVTPNGQSPRKHRRRGAGRGRKNQSNLEYGSRRRLHHVQVSSSNHQQQQQHHLRHQHHHHHHQFSPCLGKYGRSPSHTPRGSPRKTVKMASGQENKRRDAGKGATETGSHLKTLSAESLRSVSPGSDSVFYNEGDSHFLCHQCGREFDSENNELKSEETVQEEIVQPPAGFADSPENTRNKSHRMYKKQEKRFRSEERSGEKRKHTRHRAEGPRAKSEERGKEKASKTRLRPHARSTDASMEKLRAADSSPSISEPLTGDEPKVYAESFRRSSWIRVRDVDAGARFQRAPEPEDDETEAAAAEGESKEDESTSSEKEFRKKYQAATHRMVHRKSSMEMYKRLQSKSFEIESFGSLKGRLEDLVQVMLVVWSTQEKALRVVNDECDKKVIVKRKSGEFGFRIHGSRPVVVSAIEPETPAESSGLEVGDIVLSINGISVLEASHSDVVKLAHAGSDILELEVARTSAALASPTPEAEEDAILKSGFLSKRSTNGGWHRRWFVLKNDNCLYYFKSQAQGAQPMGALLLFNYKFKTTPDTGKSNSFVLEKEGAKSMELSTDTMESCLQWKTLLEKAAEAEADADRRWLEESCRLLQRPAISVPEPDCFGHLTQLEDKWRRRYCVLKDAALLFYADSSASRALAVACLQGYRVQGSGVFGKRFSFEVVPPDFKQKHFYFYTDSEIDKKRWIAAIEYSVDRWMRVA